MAQVSLKNSHSHDRGFVTKTKVPHQDRSRFYAQLIYGFYKYLEESYVYFFSIIQSRTMYLNYNTDKKIVFIFG